MGKVIRLPKARGRAERASSGVALEDEVVGDRDLLPLAVVLWVGSLARVAYAFRVGEELNTEATLALACVVLVPWLCFISYKNERW